MDPISIITAAILRGILLGLEKSLENVIYTGYLKLKELISERYSEVDLQSIEKDPRSGARLKILEEDLRNSGIENDQEVLNLANSLLETIKEFKTKKDELRNDMTSEEIFELIERNACREAIGDLVNTHMKEVMEIRRNYHIEDTDLLSTRISHIEEIPMAAKKNIGYFHNRINEVINSVAERIEEKKYNSPEKELNNMVLSYKDRISAGKLLNSDKNVHVSFQALRITVELFSELNQMIIEKIEESIIPHQQTNLILSNAILVYELTNFVISFLENFNLNGVDEIKSLHDVAKKKIRHFKIQQKELKSKASAPEIDLIIKNQILNDIEMRNKSIVVLEKEWKNYVQSILSLNNEIKVINKKIPTLELIRENAKTQIILIESVAMLQVLKQNISAIEGSILTLEKIELVTLSPNRVRRLLGIV